MTNGVATKVATRTAACPPRAQSAPRATAPRIEGSGPGTSTASASGRSPLGGRPDSTFRTLFSDSAHARSPELDRQPPLLRLPSLPAPPTGEAGAHSISGLGQGGAPLGPRSGRGSEGGPGRHRASECRLRARGERGPLPPFGSGGPGGRRRSERRLHVEHPRLPNGPAGGGDRLRAAPGAVRAPLSKH